MKLEQAAAIADGTLRRGRELGAAALTVAVLDAGGHLVVFKREDGFRHPSTGHRHRQAYGAVGMGLSSREIGRRAEKQPVFFGTLAAVASGRLAPAVFS